MQFALELIDGTVFDAESEYGTGFALKSPSFSQQPLKVSKLNWQCWPARAATTFSFFLGDF